jgi:hypothetical protein
VPARRPPRRRRLSIDLALLLVIVGGVGLGPRLMDGWAALQWTRYYAALGAAGAQHPGDVGNRAGRAAARVIDATAPLPTAQEAARLALDLGRNLEPAHAGMAAVLYAHVRGALDRATASRVRGLGLAALADEARQRESALQNRPDTRPQQ